VWHALQRAHPIAQRAMGSTDGATVSACPPACRHYIARIHGQPLNIGVFVDSTYDIGRIENVHFNPWSTPTHRRMRLARAPHEHPTHGSACGL
jgi:hypothetical protein